MSLLVPHFMQQLAYDKQYAPSVAVKEQRLRGADSRVYSRVPPQPAVQAADDVCGRDATVVVVKQHIDCRTGQEWGERRC